MRLEADLAAIKSAIAAGQLDDAKRILAGVSLNALPGSEFSRQIGDYYFELGYPAMAGRYWYLLEDKSDRMVCACEEFEHTLGDNPCLIHDTIPWFPGSSTYAATALAELHNQAEAFRREHRYDVRPQRGWRDRCCLLGCAIISFIVLFVFIMGTIFIAKMFSEEFGGRR